MWSHAIFGLTNFGEEIAPEYYTGYQTTSEHRCMGSKNWCKDQASVYFGERWNVSYVSGNRNTIFEFNCVQSKCLTTLHFLLFYSKVPPQGPAF
jgi:hypothetical protein